MVISQISWFFGEQFPVFENLNTAVIDIVNDNTFLLRNQNFDKILLKKKTNSKQNLEA